MYLNYKLFYLYLIYLFFSDFICNLSKPGVEGIYETKVTPELRALLNLGCVCSVTLEAAKKMAALPDLGNFSIEQMKQVSHKYLTNVCIIYFVCHIKLINYIFLVEFH